MASTNNTTKPGFKYGRIELASNYASFTHHRRDPHTQYWKMVWPSGSVQSLKDILEARKYAPGSCKNLDWLRECLVRSYLGQRSYTDDTNDQLRDLVKQRGIDTRTVINKRNKGTRPELLLLLDTADQNPRFEKFLLLPAEIRNRIYTMYFNGIEGPLYAPVQPPLTLASSQIRRETLQMFYDSFQFEIPLVQSRETNFARSTIEMKLRIARPAYLWFTSLSQATLQIIRRFRFDMCSAHDNRFVQVWRQDGNFVPGYLAWFDLEIVRNADGQDEVQVFFPEGPSHYHRFKVLRAHLAVKRAVAKINARQGRMCLTMEDLKVLRTAMET